MIQFYKHLRIINLQNKKQIENVGCMEEQCFDVS